MIYVFCSSSSYSSFWLEGGSSYIYIYIYLYWHEIKNNEIPARALNKIFETWKITATEAWNNSGELCSGAAIEDSVSIDNLFYNPLIKCDCSFVDSTICRIIALYVSISLCFFLSFFQPVRRIASLKLNYTLYRRARGMNVTGPIPQELWSLVYISNLYAAFAISTHSFCFCIGSSSFTHSLTLYSNLMYEGTLIRISWVAPCLLALVIWLACSGCKSLTHPLLILLLLFIGPSCRTFGANALSGPLPKEIGLLTDLRSL